MLRFGCLALLVSMVVGCSSGVSETDTDEGAAVDGPVKRCGPPTANARCADDPSDVTNTAPASLEIGEFNGRFTFFLGVNVRGSKVYNVFSSTEYGTRSDAEKGAARFLAAGLDPKNYGLANDDADNTQYVTIKSGPKPSDKVLARTTYAKSGDLKRLTNSIRLAIGNADTSVLAKYGRWKADFPAKKFSLIAGNNRPVLDSLPIQGVGDEAVSDAMLATADVGATNFETVKNVDRARVCGQLRNTGVEAWISDGVRLVYDSDTAYHFELSPSGSTTPLARSHTTYQSCETAVDGAKTAVDYLVSLSAG